MSEKDLREIQTGSRRVFAGKVLRLDVDEVRLPDGKIAEREVVRHPGAAAILATTPDERILLVEQYRYPCAEVLAEIPAGKTDVAGESPEDCARRELAEETSYGAKELTLILTFYTSAGFCDEKMYLYRARDLFPVRGFAADDDEFLRRRFMTRAEANLALAAGKIRDAKTIIALQYWFAEAAAGK